MSECLFLLLSPPPPHLPPGHQEYCMHCFIRSLSGSYPFKNSLGCFYHICIFRLDCIILFFHHYFIQPSYWCLDLNPILTYWFLLYLPRSLLLICASLPHMASLFSYIVLSVVSTDSVFYDYTVVLLSSVGYLYYWSYSGVTVLLLLSGCFLGSLGCNRVIVACHVVIKIFPIGVITCSLIL